MNIKKCVRALLCLYLTLIISINAVKAQTLKVGDTLPPELWSLPLQVINHPQGKEILTLNEYKDKLIILDFWATWCAPCIKSLSKLDTLQKEFGEQLAVMPITYEAANKAAAMFKKRGWSLPSVVNDSLLKEFFPYRSIPHQVWVREGKVQAITGAEYATSDIIKKKLNRESVHMKVKEEDMDFNARKLLLPLEDGFVESGLKSRVNINNGGVSISSYGLLCYNRSLLALLKEAHSIDYPFTRFDNRLISALPDSLHLKIFLPEDSLQLPDNQYTYLNRSRFSRSRKDIYAHMQQDIKHYLNTALGIKTTLEKRAMKCWVIKQVSPEKVDLSETDTYHYTSENKPFSFFVYALTKANQTKPSPIISEANVQGNVTIRLRSNLDDLTNVNKELLHYGFTLVEEVREIEVMLLTTIPQQVK